MKKAVQQLTARGLRATAEARGFPVSGRQLADFRDAGLLPESSADETWPVEIVDQLVRIRQLGHEPGLRSLDRRAIRLWTEGWPITPHVLKRAVIAVARVLSSPQRKMLRVWRARRWVGEPDYRTQSPRRRQRADPSERRLPKRADWEEILARADAEEIAKYFGFLAHLADATKPLGVAPLELVAEVPVEEIAVLMLIQDLALAAPSTAANQLGGTCETVDQQ